MQKKRKPKKAEVTDQVQAEVHIAPEKPEPKAPAAKKPTKEEQLVSLQDFARLNVVSWRDHWWKNIEQYAKNQGWNSTDATEAQCRALLSSWGAIIK